MDNIIYSVIDRTPYTYLIGWSNLNIWYYGVRFRKGCSPSDLWNPYKTSSKHVKEFIKEHGDPDIIQIRHIFQNKKKAQKWEIKCLRRMKVVKDLKWLNKHIPGGKWYNNNDIPISKETKERMSKAAKIRIRNRINPFQKRPDGTSVASDRVANGTNPFIDSEFQKKHAKERVRNGTHPFLGGKIASESNKARVRNGTHHLLDKEKASERANKKLKEGTHPSQIKACCIHCKEEVNLFILGKFHGDNCLDGPLFNSFLLIIFKISVLQFYPSIPLI